MELERERMKHDAEIWMLEITGRIGYSSHDVLPKFDVTSNIKLAPIFDKYFIQFAGNLNWSKTILEYSSAKCD